MHPCPARLLCHWRHVQGSRDHPKCFALHCWAAPFSALVGERPLSAKKMGQVFSLPASCFHPGLCLPGQLAFFSLYMCVCVCVTEQEEEHKKGRTWKRGEKKQVQWLAAKPSPVSSPRLIWLAPLMLLWRTGLGEAGRSRAGLGRTWSGMLGIRKGILGKFSTNRTPLGGSSCVGWC